VKHSSSAGGVYLLEQLMKTTVSIAILMATFAASAMACEKPTAPALETIPDGKTAAMAEMMAAKKTVDAFKTAMEEYLSCEKSAAKLDHAQAELEKVANRFNEQVRAFKTKS
jgi:aspartate oxidase